LHIEPGGFRGVGLAVLNVYNERPWMYLDPLDQGVWSPARDAFGMKRRSVQISVDTVYTCSRDTNFLHAFAAAHTDIDIRTG